VIFVSTGTGRFERVNVISASQLGILWRALLADTCDLGFDQIDRAGTGDFLVVIETLAKGERRFAMLREVMTSGAACGGQTVSPRARAAQFGLDHDVLVWLALHGVRVVVKTSVW